MPSIELMRPKQRKARSTPGSPTRHINGSRLVFNASLFIFQYFLLYTFHNVEKKESILEIKFCIYCGAHFDEEFCNENQAVLATCPNSPPPLKTRQTRQLAALVLMQQPTSCPSLSTATSPATSAAQASVVVAAEA